MLGTKDKAQTGPWLIKSGDRVLGPFTSEEIIDLLRNREVVVIDEIMAPFGRWAYIRDAEAFAEIVDEIRRGHLQAKEDTEVQGYHQETVVTEIGNAETQTPTPTEPTLHAAPIAAAAAPVKFEIPKTKVLPPQAREPEIKRRSSGVFISAIVLLMAVALALFLTSRRSTSTAAGEKNIESIQTQASVAWKRGEFREALELYRKLDRQSPNQPLVATRLALLMMKLDGQTVEAKRLLQAARENATDPALKSEIEIALGVAALQNQNAKEAADHFEASGTSWIASYDRGVALAELNSWNEAIKSFEAAGQTPIALASLAVANLNLAQVSGRQSQAMIHRRAAESALRQGELFADFRQENAVIGAYADVVGGNHKRAETRVASALETDPEQTADHFHDPSLSLEHVSWNQLLVMCRAIDAELKATSARALLGLCLAKAGKFEDASKTIDEALSRDPANANLHSVNAYLHMLAQRDDAAQASLTRVKKAGSADSSQLAQILSTRLCERAKLLPCIEEGWSKLASENPPVLTALTGLAAAKFAQGDASTGNALLVSAEKISPTYLPLLRLREEASR